jgi:hypothetical protein
MEGAYLGPAGRERFALARCAALHREERGGRPSSDGRITRAGLIGAGSRADSEPGALRPRRGRAVGLVDPEDGLVRPRDFGQDSGMRGRHELCLSALPTEV